MKTRRTSVASLLLWAALPGSALAEDAAPQVGVEERLGQTVPATELSFTDEAGKPVKLADLMDRPVVLSLVYFRCGSLCSPLLQDLAKATDNGALSPGQDFRMISVSFDPKDRSDIAAQKQKNALAKMKKKNPSPESWRFLVGDEENIRKLTQAVGFNFMESPDGQDFNHPGVVVFLSKEGKICRYLHGTQFNPVDIQMAVEDAAKGQTRSIIRTISQLCFAYDPVGRTYVLAINRIILAVTGLFALSFFAFLILRRRPSAETGSHPAAIAQEARRSEA